jgi:thymidylate synthase (FAD)
MQVRPIWVTPDAEKQLLYIARVSSNNQDSTDTRLITYLMKHGHYSPFEMVNACFEIITSRAITAQIIRHRSFSFQEFSQRYAYVTEIEPIELRMQATKNRQSSTEVFNPVIEKAGSIELRADMLIRDHIQKTKALYEELVGVGVAKESARMVLPMATQSKIYMNGTLRSWLSYLNLRLKEDTQKEHREIAYAIAEILGNEFPHTYAATNNFGDMKGGFM